MLFDTYYGDMYKVSQRYLKVNEDVQDVLCEAFIRIFNRLESFEYRGEGSLNRWIKTIVINESLRHIERNKQLIHREEIEDVDVPEYPETDEQLDMEVLNEIVQNLPDGYRIIFLMYVIEGFSHKEIANKLDISVSTSKSQLFKARNLIIKDLRKIEAYEAHGNRE